MSSRALFLDRDGTLVHASHYPFIRHVEETTIPDLVYRPATWQVRQEVAGVTRG